eukprot:27259_2
MITVDNLKKLMKHDAFRVPLRRMLCVYLDGLVGSILNPQQAGKAQSGEGVGRAGARRRRCEEGLCIQLYSVDGNKRSPRPDRSLQGCTASLYPVLQSRHGCWSEVACPNRGDQEENSADRFDNMSSVQNVRPDYRQATYCCCMFLEQPSSQNLLSYLQILRSVFYNAHQRPVQQGTRAYYVIKQCEWRRSGYASFSSWR